MGFEERVERFQQAEAGAERRLLVEGVLKTEICREKVQACLKQDKGSSFRVEEEKMNERRFGTMLKDCEFFVASSLGIDGIY